MELKIFDYNYYDNDIAAQRTLDILNPLFHPLEGLWLYREPEIRTEGNDLPTFTVVSPYLGLMFIRVFSETNECLDAVDEKFWIINKKKVKSGFQKFRNYVHKIRSKLDDPIIDMYTDIPIKTVYFFPYITRNIFHNVILKDNEAVLYDDISNFSPSQLNEPINENDYSLLINIVQNASIINKFSNVYVDEPAQNMFDAIELNNKRIAQFDYDQMAASLTITDKSERIRGLAGSGKTVLLAMKAARLHKRFPEKKIAFVFYTKSLYNQANNLIKKYYNQISDDEPNWDNLRVLHSWGGTSSGEGFYSLICKEHGVTPKTFSQGSLANNCEDLINNVDIHPFFDFILIDEAQDFPLEFFLLVEKTAKPPKKVVVAYDELQTTNNISIPQFDKLFGESNGMPNIELDPKHDYILKKSYRNTLEVLLTAFSFGFGFYHNIIQIIQDPATWDALGFECKTKLNSGEMAIITRKKHNSPNSIIDFYPGEKAVNCKVFSNINENIRYITEKISSLISQEKVKPSDILVIDINMNKFKFLNKLQYTLQSCAISSHIPGIVSDARDFFVDEHVTLTTPRNAKGNEVPVVFVVGCEAIYLEIDSNQQRNFRNFLFISITRSKGWAYLSAVGQAKQLFLEEFEKIQGNIPDIKFIYPSESKLNELAKIDFLTNNPVAKKLDENVSTIKSVISSGNEAVLKQLINLDPDFKDALKKILEG